MKTKIKKTLDFTQEEVNKFIEIQRVLTALNTKYNPAAELELSRYTEDQIAECSGYYELLTSEKFKD